MKKKMTYFAPETEQMEVRVETGFLNISTGVSSNPSGENMTGYDTTEDW